MNSGSESHESKRATDGSASDDLEADGGQAGGVAFEEPESTDTVELNIDDDVLIDGVGMPVFVLDREGSIAAWNHSIEELTGNGDDDDAIGSARPSAVFYPDGRETEMLAQRVLETPESADEHPDVELEDGDLSLYAREETMTDRWGETRHLRHTSMPLYEADGAVGELERSVAELKADGRQ